MSLIVADFTQFIYGVELYQFSENKTEKYVVNPGNTDVATELSNFIIANKEIEKIVFIGSEKVTESIKNRVSSSLESHYGYSNPVEIELKNDWK